MPTYFFDIDDGEMALRDQCGVELETLGEAAAQAAALLPDLARDTLPGMTSRDFIVSVRDGDDRVVHRAALLFRAQWVPDAGAAPGELRSAPVAMSAFRKAARTGGVGAGRPQETRGELVAFVPGAGRDEEGGKLRRTSAEG